MKRDDLNQYLAQLLQPEKFSDYCPNGLQVEGKMDIYKIVTGVTACQALLQAAHKANADAIFVHHGYFWRGEDLRITGIKKSRIQFLLANDINLFAYHLPLDAHETLGNNVMLAKQFGWQVSSWHDSLVLIDLPQEQALVRLAEHVHKTLSRKPLVIGNDSQRIKRIAICTGGAQGFIEQAYAAGADCYISGEISEQTVHAAIEASKSCISAGHHATERYGVQALGEYLAQKFGLQHEFIDVDNPV
jgi:dinuclear metal center YbgI/SA1388 family protein